MKTNNIIVDARRDALPIPWNDIKALEFARGKPSLLKDAAILAGMVRYEVAVPLSQEKVSQALSN